MRVRLTLSLLILPLEAFAQSKPETAPALETFVVTGKRPVAADAVGPDGIRTYDESEIEASGAFTLQEFMETLPRGNGEEQLILVDGVPMEPTALTPAMIASIEVSYSGAMPQYGAYSRGRIINLRLKQDYEGGEVTLTGTGSVHADAWRREVLAGGGILRGPWRMNYSAEYSRQDPVTADARGFSREQDHRARGGRDFRLPWGDPAVVQAVTGNLNGVFDAAGNPVPVALVPAGAAGSPAPGNFLPVAGPAASGQRFFNTSPYLYLASPSERLSGQFGLNRTLGKLRLGASVAYNTNRSSRAGPPPVSATTAATLVPAAFNPFGQDVLVGLVHTGFGPVHQRSESNGARLSLTATWMDKGWRLSGYLTHSRSQAENDTRDLDPAAFTAALAAANPAARFNPFAGDVGAANAALYPALAIHRTQETASNTSRLFALASGPLAQGWGAGPVQFSLRASASWREDERTTRNLRGLADVATHEHDADYGLNGNLDLPFLKERPRFYRLDGRLNANYSTNDRGGDSRRQGVGLSWSPVRSWVFRANVDQRISSPGERGYDDPESTVETLMDPRRTPTAVENVQVTSRRSATTESSRGDGLQVNVTFEPAARPGLQFNLGYSQQHNSRGTGSPFRPQDVVDNEALFAGRVIREVATPADLALGQPGRILVVDTTASAVANDEQRNVDFAVEYQLSPQNLNRSGTRGTDPRSGPAGNRPAVRGAGTGPRAPVAGNRFNLSLRVEYPLESRYEVAEGQAFVSRESGPANRPEWTARTQLRWSNRGWNAGVNIRHNAASRLGTIPAFTTGGLDVSYRFTTAFWGKFGKGVRLRTAVQNLGRNIPPYADTLLGYRGGSGVGTTVGLTVQVPL